MTYQPYPTSGGRNQMAERPPAPQSIQNAVKLMYVGAGLSIVELIIGLATLGSLKSAILKRNPSFTTSQVHSAEAVSVAIVILVGLLGAGLWVWMARSNAAGKSWARVVSSVLFGIFTLELISALARANATAGLVLDILVWLVGLGAIVLLWRRESSEYFAASR
jgi:hypothetical protein